MPNRKKGIGYSTPDDELIDLLAQGLENGQLGRDLGASDDGHQGSCRMLERLAQRAQFPRKQRARTRDRRKTCHTMGRGLGAMRGRESIHHVDIAQRGHTP